MYVKPEVKAMRMNLKYEVMALSSLSEDGATEVMAPQSLF